jgi:hypothetical protein
VSAPVAVLLFSITTHAGAAMPIQVDRGPGEPIAAETLRSPAVLENASRTPGTVEVTLVAGATRMTLLLGVETDVYSYNGSVPGPTLELREGDRVIIHFRNDLPEETTVHWHGLHIPWNGSPPGQGNFPAEPDYLGIGMPWPSWRYMSDDDLWALIAYLRHGLKPVDNEVDASEAPADKWASVYTVQNIGPYPAPAFPTANEAGGR